MFFGVSFRVTHWVSDRGCLALIEGFLPRSSGTIRGVWWWGRQVPQGLCWRSGETRRKTYMIVTKAQCGERPS